MAKSRSSKSSKSSKPSKSRTSKPSSKPKSKPKSKPVKVVKESPTGRNEKFELPDGRVVTRAQFAAEIDAGKHPDYHNRSVGGRATPAANPDGVKGNNLD